MKRKGQKKRGAEEKPGKEVTRLRSEKQAFRGGEIQGSSSSRSSLSQTEPASKIFWDTEQAHRHPASCWSAGIARQPLLKAEAIMGPLCTGQGRSRDVWVGREGRLHLHLQALTCELLHACSTMEPPAPVLPEERSRPDDEGMQQHTHLTRLGGGPALPLTLLAQRAGAATADAGRIHHAQAPIGFCAPLVCAEGLPGRTAQCPIGLESKVATREVVLFPGQGDRGLAIARGGGLLLWRSGHDGGSKLGSPYRGRLQVMPQFQAQVPHPWRDDLPRFLTARRVRTPAVGVLFLCAA